MSEPQKTVEETQPQAAAAETPAENPDTTTEALTPADPSKETPAESTEANPAPAAESNEAAAEQPKEEDQKEAKEVTFASEGVLGYKAPGLVKGLRFSKRFVYFHDEPVPAKQLTIFHQNEKPAVANPIAAWASQTGKGLLFLTKRSEDKATPGGIINLADVGDIIKEGNEFHFKVDGHKHTFQAANTTERDSWIATLKAKSATAKDEKESITSSEGYKAELKKLTNPYEAIAKKASENKEAKKEEGKEEEGKKEEPKKEESAPAEEQKDQKATSKSRSQSRKRASIFGSLLGKKDDAEEKKDEKKEEKKEDKPEGAKPAEGAAETPAEAPAADTAAEAAPATDGDKKEEQKDDKKEEAKEEKKEKAEAPTNQKSKRSSLFGNFFQKVSSPAHEKSEKEATAPAETSVASTAPQLDNPVEEAAVKPIEPESVTSPTDGEAAKDGTATESPAAANGVSKDRRRSSFFGFGKKKGDSDTEGTDGESKKNKLGTIFRKPSKAVKADKETKETPAESESKPEPIAKDEAKEEKPAESKPEETAKAPETAAEESKPTNIPSTSTTVQAAA